MGILFWDNDHKGAELPAAALDWPGAFVLLRENILRNGTLGTTRQLLVVSDAYLNPTAKVNAGLSESTYKDRATAASATLKPLGFSIGQGTSRALYPPCDTVEDASKRILTVIREAKAQPKGACTILSRQHPFSNTRFLDDFLTAVATPATLPATPATARNEGECSEAGDDDESKCFSKLPIDSRISALADTIADVKRTLHSLVPSGTVAVDAMITSLVHAMKLLILRENTVPKDDTMTSHAQDVNLKLERPVIRGSADKVEFLGAPRAIGSPHGHSVVINQYEDGSTTCVVLPTDWRGRRTEGEGADMIDGM